jgi:hypothetical protein
VLSSGKNLISLVVMAGLVLTILTFGVIGSVNHGNYVVVAIVFTALGICVLAVMLNHYRVRMLLRDKTPDRIISHYHRSVRRIPNADAAAAYLSALAAAFYGQFDRARQELDAVDWDRTTAVYRGHRFYVLATLALLEDTDYPKALQLARQASELESREAGGGLQALDDVIHSVAEGPTPDMITRLERIAKKQQGLMAGMCAWALAVYYKREGQMEKAADFKESLRMSVPFSAPMLNQTPPARDA